MPESPAKPFNGIFVSYRRDDSSGHAGRLFDKLVDHFGEAQIFMDIDTIEPGEDFVSVIENAVGSCEILIAIIGRRWLSRTTGRLDNPNDFVRLEIATALKRDIRVIPLLVQGATMPTPQDLPEDLSRLSRRNALELSDTRWRHDVEQLISALERILAKREEVRSRAAQEDEERQRQEAETRETEEALLAETARQAEEERQRREAEEKRRLEEDAERRKAEELQLRETEEASRRRAAEERRLEKEKAERISREAEEAKRQRAAERARQVSREEKQTKPLDVFAGPAKLNSSPPERLHTEHAPADPARATPLRGGKGKRTVILVVLAGVVVLVVVGLLWKRQTTGVGQQSGNQAVRRSTGETVPPSDTSMAKAAPQPPPGMVYVSGGEFMMGRNSSDPMETPAHKVSVRPFFVGVTEVTCEEYKKFLDVNPDQAAPQNWVNRNYPVGAARKPVTGVDWDHANAYATWSGRRLPTEEEWEFAARGTDGRLYPWGNRWKAGLANTGKPEAGDNDGALGMKEVGSYQGRSPYGVYDMIGNAWEWTASDLKVYPGGVFRSPVDPSRNFKVIRGGSWTSRNDLATATYRRGYGARGEKLGYSYTGFRLVKDITNNN